MLKNERTSFGQSLPRHLGQFSLLFVLWIVLFERLDGFVVWTGIFASISVVLFTNRYLLRGKYPDYYSVSFSFILRYGAVLLKEIFFSGFSVLPKIFSRNVDAEIVLYTTKLTNPLLVNVLANSITLTPGTVTVEKNKSQLKILTFANAEKTAEDIIPSNLERLLLEYEQTKHTKTGG